MIKDALRSLQCHRYRGDRSPERLSVSHGPGQPTLADPGFKQGGLDIAISSGAFQPQLICGSNYSICLLKLFCVCQPGNFPVIDSYLPGYAGRQQAAVGPYHLPREVIRHLTVFILSVTKHWFEKYHFVLS